MTLANYTFQFGSFTFGAGTPFVINSVDGLEGLPEIRSQDDARGYNDGSYSGRDFLGARTITFDMVILAGNSNTAMQNFQLLQNALLPQQSGTTIMQFKLSPSDAEMQIGGRVRTRLAKLDPDYTYGYIRAQISLYCPDPRYYDNTATTGNMTVQPDLGRTYDKTYAYNYGGGSVINSLTVTNSGNWITYPVITITGPITNPTVGNVTTGQYMQVNGSYTNSDSIVIDLNQKLITLNGTTARNLLAGNSEWFGAPPGVSNFYFTGLNTLAGTTSATVVYRSAYI